MLTELGKQNISGLSMLDRWVVDIRLNRPELKDNTADAERLISVLKKEVNADVIDIDLSVLRKIPFIMRRSGYHVKCVVFKDINRWILIDVCDAADNYPFLGLAIDLGTTRVVFRLVDIETGTGIAELSFDNPQIQIGPDILTRIHFSEKGEGLVEIQKLIINGINRNIQRICEKSGVSKDRLFLLSIAGNTTMTHLFLGISPYHIIREPYIPAINRPGLMHVKDIDLDVYQNAWIYVFPNIGSYFGGDLIAGILYSGMNKKKDISILVDVGTNAEVVLGNSEFMIACAGAAGPALEGGVSSIGMMAGPGVIDRVMISEHGLLEFHTIDELPPVGICGSGFIDLAAVLFLTGAIDLRGRIVPERSQGRCRWLDEMNHLIIVPADQTGNGQDLMISQASLDSLIRSKAAMYTILETIAMNVGLSLTDLKLFYVAGTFGSFINPRSAITIGMLPDLLLETYQTLGNSSLGGASMMLESRSIVDEVDRLRDGITYIELNVDQGFMNRFSGAKFIPHTNPDLFPSVKSHQN